MQATIVITSKNRKGELQRALDSCVAQTARPEILVIDDGSKDGTAELVRSQYPGVRLVRSETSQGLIVQRNNAGSLVVSDIIISIDDDAVFSRDDIVAEVVRQFSDSRIAAVAIPFVNVNGDRILRQDAPDSSEIWITNEFIGTAHALRREVFLKVGGYRGVLFHQGEEGDLCIRLLEQGYVVRLGRSAPIHHFESKERSLKRMNLYGQRNLVLFAWHNVPFPELLAHLLVTIINGLIWGLRHGCLKSRIEGTLAGLCGVLCELRNRTPVSRKTYWLYRRLKTEGPLRFSIVESQVAAKNR